MKTKIIKLLLLSVSICLWPNLAAIAQSLSADQDELIWKTSGYRNIVTQEEKIEEGVFQTTIDNIFWTHNQGKTTEILPVLSKQDTWPDINEDGAVIFSVTRNKVPGKIRFQKSNGQTKITLEFIDKKINTTPYEYAVSGVIKKD